MEPDGALYALPGCKASFNVLYLTWTDINGGHYRQKHAAYLRPTPGQLIPPGWRCHQPKLAEVFRETAPANVHEGQASVRVVAKPGGGLTTVSRTTDPGRPYRLSLWVRGERGGVQLRVTKGANLEPVRSVAPGWTRLAVDFVADDRRVDLRVEGVPDQPESVFLVDDASLRELP